MIESNHFNDSRSCRRLHWWFIFTSIVKQMLELSIVITDEKLVLAGNVLSCVANEINQHVPFAVIRDEDDRRCFVYCGKKRDIWYNEVRDNHGFCNYGDISDFLNSIKKEINKLSHITNLRILDLTYAGPSAPNNIDFQEALHPTPSLKMSNYRKQLKKGIDESHHRFPKRKTFWITKETDSILRHHFNVIGNVYAFKLSFDDMSFDGFHEIHKQNDNTYIIWKQTKNDSLHLMSALADGDEKKFFDYTFTFYMGETLSKRFFVIFDFFKKEAYLLHQRSDEIQTFECIDKNLQLSELMFVHDENGCIQLFNRQDSVAIHEDDVICKEMKNPKVYKLSFNAFIDEGDL